MSAKKLIPFFLAGIGVGLCLLVIAAAGFVAFDRATNPASREVAAESGDAEKDGDDAKEPVSEEAAQPEPVAEPDAEEAIETPADSEAPAAEPSPNPVKSAESSFVQTAREELGVPDDAAITYQIGEPYYWEGAGITVTPIAFYQGDVLVASADCTADGSPATTILGYPGMLS